MQKPSFTNNQLKIIAMLTMTVDHVGAILLPQVTWLRLIGRLAFPIYAFMIAEGCRHTRSLPRYLATLGALAGVCQGVYFFAMGSLHQSILVTFTLSVGLCMLVKLAAEKRSFWTRLALGGAVVGVFWITQLLPGLLSYTDFSVDYGFFGVMLPVCVYWAGTKTARLAVAGLVLGAMALTMWPGQWASLLALPLLALYNGHRGKLRLKWLFYFYYPLHLVILQGLSLIL